MNCGCGFSTEYPTCNGTHKVVKTVKDKIIADVEAVSLESELSNEEFRALMISIIRKSKGI
jgi:CDGSH-type Zn-finger protein